MGLAIGSLKLNATQAFSDLHRAFPFIVSDATIFQVTPAAGKKKCIQQQL